jgi:hypothetical protein
MTYKEIKFFLLLVFFIFSLDLSAKEKTDSRGVEKKISELIGMMTLEEKVAIIHGNTMFTNGGCPRLGIPSIHMSDGPHGVREEISVNSFKPAGWTTDSASYFLQEQQLLQHGTENFHTYKVRHLVLNQEQERKTLFWDRS